MFKQNNLEIFIITYNRAQYLKQTLCQLLEDSSPVKNFDIKILDNCSTDDTQSICQEFINKNKNLTYIKNNRNIGAIGNVIKAMELASKEWFWILGDDDNYDWTGWDEVNEALNKDYDAISVCWHGEKRSTAPWVLLNEFGFISTGIYKTKLLNPITMQNAYYLSLDWNPHSAIALELINSKGKIFNSSKKIVLENMKKDYKNIQIKNIKLHPGMRATNIIYSTLKIYQLVIDKKLRYKCNNILVLGSSFKKSMEVMLNINLSFIKFLEVLTFLNFRQKIILFEVCIERIFKILFKKIFSIKNNKDKTHKIITICGIKIKVKRKH